MLFHICISPHLPCDLFMAARLYPFFYSTPAYWYLGIVFTSWYRAVDSIRDEPSVLKAYQMARSEIVLASGISSGLSSHQSLSESYSHFLRGVQLANVSGTTTGKGPFLSFFFELNHYATGGVIGHRHCSCLCPPLRLRGRTGVLVV